MRLLDSGNKKEPKVNSSRNRPDGDQENLAGMAQRNFPLLALPILRSQFLTPSKLIKQQSEYASFHGRVKLNPMKGVYHRRLLEYEILQNVSLTHLPDYSVKGNNSKTTD